VETAENEGGFQGNRRRGIPDHIGSAEAKSHSQGERPLSRALVEKLEDVTKELGVEDSGVCGVQMSLPEFGILASAVHWQGVFSNL
jgi:hypothetical protein